MPQNVIDPRVVERHCGGWLAVSPGDCSVKIGVSAESRDIAVARFHSAMAEWRKILSTRPERQDTEVSDAR